MNDSTPERGTADVAALELMKQLITLSSGVLALSATFVDNLLSASVLPVIFLVAAWGALIIAVVCALNTISAIVQSRLDGNNGWSKNAGKRWASSSKWAFVIGLIAFSGFALASILTDADAAQVFKFL